MPVDIVSGIVCTRNRPDSLRRTVRSLLASQNSRVELIVVDQSDGSEAEEALAPFAADERLRYVRSHVRGKGAAMNEAARCARGAILVFTDDDCEVQSGWMEAMAKVLREQPRVAVLFCNVVAAECNWSEGYVPTYQRRKDRRISSLIQTCTGHGMGAGMAVRRDFVLGLGGFDEEVGPGARFPSGDDWDIAHRALLNGWDVYETADLAVLHHGFRTHAEGRDHVYRDWLAIGAVCAKPIRAGHWTAIALPVWYFAVHALWPPVSDVFRLRRPQGLSRIRGFFDGLLQGARTPVNRRTLLFKPLASRPA